MRTAQLIYHDAPEGWWAASPDLPGYSAAGTSFEEVRDLARDGAPWYADEALDLHHLIPGPHTWWTVPSVGQRARLELAPQGPNPGLSIRTSGLQTAA
ncbi:type II toxin-antitoxin system HicB family antitoxin [Conexibacter sp. CPCC 206217]|uniref:type II toxin-antitoxin system HicB family antitoxin n=1 Tax=Conexibacter sp. CPCC 206217 TaxID=3064574 RepID=UPI00272428EB|nr:type II toxin-antitoxin system HicB family antitoxin [Conexibacter sp. CPCC 206217]MDO8210778.1 type II toxin-antitoxin system HicB family antitoxin [Conexibacter sp. CPCC 206217]